MRGFVDKMIFFQYPEIMNFMPRKDIIPNMETQLVFSSAHPSNRFILIFIVTEVNTYLEKKVISDT